MKSKFEMMSELGEIQENSKQLAKTNNFVNITLGELLSQEEIEEAIKNLKEVFGLDDYTQKLLDNNPF